MSCQPASWLCRCFHFFQYCLNKSKLRLNGQKWPFSSDVSVRREVQYSAIKPPVDTVEVHCHQTLSLCAYPDFITSLAANIDGMRHKPDSFYDQRYYTEAILDFKAFDDVKRYARFRLMPSDESPETGLLSEEEQREPW